MRAGAIAPFPPRKPFFSMSRHQRQRRQLPSLFSRRPRLLLPILVALALTGPIFFHFRLRRLHQMRLRKCGWLDDPPFVCAHGGDSTNAVPNTMSAYHFAIRSHVDCMEIDVSRSSDGVLFALHDRDLQRMLGNNTVKVGHMSAEEIKQLNAGLIFTKEFHGQGVPTVEDALLLVSESVKRVILDAKVGPPMFEKGLAEDIVSTVNRATCKNCVIWAKSDTLVRDVINMSGDAMIGYIVMRDPSTGRRSNLLRIRRASVVGVYHHLIDDKLVQILHGMGKKVYAWTVDEKRSMLKMLYDRVDAIVTGNPLLLQSLMEDVKTECIQEGFALP